MDSKSFSDAIRVLVSHYFYFCHPLQGVNSIATGGSTFASSYSIFIISLVQENLFCKLYILDKPISSTVFVASRSTAFFIAAYPLLYIGHVYLSLFR